jgi:hypothetical protein
VSKSPVPNPAGVAGSTSKELFAHPTGPQPEYQEFSLQTCGQAEETIDETYQETNVGDCLPYMQCQPGKDM